MATHRTQRTLADVAPALLIAVLGAGCGMLLGAYYRASLDGQSCTHNARAVNAGWEYTVVGECELS